MSCENTSVAYLQRSHKTSILFLLGIKILRLFIIICKVGRNYVNNFLKLLTAWLVLFGVFSV